MAPAGGRTDPSLKSNCSLEKILFERGYEFDFFQAVRLLARIFASRKSVGTTAKPGEELVRFGGMAGCRDVSEARLAMAFPASPVHTIDPVGQASGPVPPGSAAPDSQVPARMTVSFFGLTGTQGVLPLCYTEWMIARRASRDDTLTAFFDLFNHRLISLFYRAWEKHTPPVLYELAGLRGQRPDPFTQYLFDLIGMGTEGLRGRMRVPDESLLRYAGLIGQRPLAAASLRGILRDFFSVPVEIEQCIGDWYELEDDDLCYLAPDSERNQLGHAAFCGSAVWNQQSLFRIRLGPLALERFLEFLPDGSVLSKLTELTTFLVGQSMAFDVQLVLRAEDVPYARLSDEGEDAPRLGWIGWLKTAEFEIPAGDAVFRWVN